MDGIPHSFAWTNSAQVNFLQTAGLPHSAFMPAMERAATRNGGGQVPATAPNVVCGKWNSFPALLVGGGVWGGHHPNKQFAAWFACSLL
jgi:hypothetical protein